MTKLFKQQTGFLMLEVVIATLIITVALVAAVGMFISSTQANADAAEYTVAASLAQKQLEMLKTKDPINYWSKIDLSTPSEISWQDSTQSLPLKVNNVSYNVKTVAANCPENANLVQVTVTVSWNKSSPRPDSSVQITTSYSKVTMQN